MATLSEQGEEYRLFRQLCDCSRVCLASASLATQYTRQFQQKQLPLKQDKNCLILRAPMRYLDITRICAQLPPDPCLPDCHQRLHVVYQTESTQNTICVHPPGHCVLAEYQSQGHGRKGHTWVSPLGCFLYFTLSLPLRDNTLHSFFSLYVSLLLHQVLHRFDARLQLKWPNDLYLNNKKLGGIILEQTRIHNQPCVLIGVGININPYTGENLPLTRPFTTLASDRAQPLDRNRIAAVLIPVLFSALQSFRAEKIPEYQDYYHRFLIHRETPLIITEGKERYSATWQAVNPDGSLLTRTPDGERRNLYAADVSLCLEEL